MPPWSTGSSSLRWPRQASNQPTSLYETFSQPGNDPFHTGSISGTLRLPLSVGSPEPESIPVLPSMNQDGRSWEVVAPPVIDSFGQAWFALSALTVDGATTFKLLCMEVKKASTSDAPSTVLKEFYLPNSYRLLDQAVSLSIFSAFDQPSTISLLFVASDPSQVQSGPATPAAVFAYFVSSRDLWEPVLANATTSASYPFQPVIDSRNGYIYALATTPSTGNPCILRYAYSRTTSPSSFCNPIGYGPITGLAISSAPETPQSFFLLSNNLAFIADWENIPFSAGVTPKAVASGKNRTNLLSVTGWSGVAILDGNISMLNQYDLNPIWRLDNTASGKVDYVGADVSNGLLFVCTGHDGERDGTLLALNNATGTKEWRYEPPCSSSTVYTLVGSQPGEKILVVPTTSDLRIYTYSAASPSAAISALQLRRTLPGTRYLSFLIHNTPAIEAQLLTSDGLISGSSDMGRDPERPDSQADQQPGSKLSSGAIAGIVIACVAGALLLIAAVLIMKRNVRRENPERPSDSSRQNRGEFREKLASVESPAASAGGLDPELTVGRLKSGSNISSSSSGDERGAALRGENGAVEERDELPARAPPSGLDMPSVQRVTSTRTSTTGSVRTTLSSIAAMLLRNPDTNKGDESDSTGDSTMQESVLLERNPFFAGSRRSSGASALTTGGSVTDGDTAASTSRPTPRLTPRASFLDEVVPHGSTTAPYPPRPPPPTDVVSVPQSPQEIKNPFGAVRPGPPPRLNTSASSDSISSGRGGERDDEGSSPTTISTGTTFHTTHTHPVSSQSRSRSRSRSRHGNRVNDGLSSSPSTTFYSLDTGSSYSSRGRNGTRDSHTYDDDDDALWDMALGDLDLELPFTKTGADIEVN
ncbi:hypothetical protein BC832DRAFT_552403, partial [Gaertneriomyces semiglobifer]